MLPYSLLVLAQSTACLSGQFTVDDSPSLSIWDEGQSTWIDALADIAPQSPPFNWPNISTIARARSTWDEPTPSIWDGGLTDWIDDRTGYTPGAPSPQWVNGPAIARRVSKWDEPPASIWDGGITHWTDVAPGWDTPPGTERRTWVVGRAGPFGCNLISGTGERLTARIWIRPPDPRTLPQRTRRAIAAEAVALWKRNPDLCTITANHTQPGEYWSAYHRWMSYYLRTH